MLTIITGTGRSGTSFVAKCFHAAGAPIAASWRPEVQAGMEDPLCKPANLSLYRRAPFLLCGEEVTEEERAAMAAACAGPDRVVKDPLFSCTLDAWAHIDSIACVILCLRDPREAVASRLRAGMADEGPHNLATYLARIGYVQTVCALHEIPLDVICWPQLLAEEPGRWTPDRYALGHALSPWCGATDRALEILARVEEAFRADAR